MRRKRQSISTHESARIIDKEDFAFWDLPERKVLKIHGSINNIGSIIVTAEDYGKCLRRLRGNIIGSYLKLLLATKTVVFIGYCFDTRTFRSAGFLLGCLNITYDYKFIYNLAKCIHFMTFL